MNPILTSEAPEFVLARERDRLTPELVELLLDQQRAALRTELRKSDYDGMARGAAYRALHDPREETRAVFDGIELSATTVYQALGLPRGRELLAALSEASEALTLPVLKPARFSGEEYRNLLSVLELAGATGAEIDAVKAKAKLLMREEKIQLLPRIGSAFVGVPYFPNVVPDDEFDAAWREVRGG